jgi:glutamate synthase (NADPH/NADH) small chain
MKQVAIIGTGPAGMAAAQVLAQAGINVTMFEKADRPGGILMYGIPHMKLDKHNVIKKAKGLENLGIKFILNTNVSKKDISKTIKNQFDATLIATGAEKARDIEIDGRHLNNIYFAMEYLTDNTKHLLDKTPLQIDAKDKKVVIIGGGDTANDCVATALSQGASAVLQLEVANKDQSRKKNAYGFNEDKIRLYQKTAVRFLNKDGDVAKVITDDVSIVRDSSGTKMEFKNNHGELEADLVIVAIGFLGPLEEALEAFDVQFDRNLYHKDSQVFTTNQSGIFICGDARRGPSLIKWAIMEGKLAAEEIIKYLAI